jgi:hypothetical protein
MNAWPRVCGCGRSYSAEQWRELVGAGRMDLGDGEAIDLRHCACKSTISVLVSDLEEDARIAFALRKDERLSRLYEAADKALDLTRTFVREDRAAGVAPWEDHRVTSALRQFGEYLRAIKRLDAMPFVAGDDVLLVTMAEELRPTG